MLILLSENIWTIKNIFFYLSKLQLFENCLFREAHWAFLTCICLVSMNPCTLQTLSRCWLWGFLKQQQLMLETSYIASKWKKVNGHSFTPHHMPVQYCMLKVLCSVLMCATVSFLVWPPGGAKSTHFKAVMKKKKVIWQKQEYTPVYLTVKWNVWTLIE